MNIKVLIVCNLLLLNAIGINKKAIATPNPEIKDKQMGSTSPWPKPTQARYLTIPQWSKPIDIRYLNIPQWSEPMDTRYLNIPQWSQPIEIIPRTTPQWSEVGSPQIQKPSFELLPPVVPGAAEKEIKELNRKKPHPIPPLTKGREPNNQVLPPLTKGGLGGVNTTFHQSLKELPKKLSSNLNSQAIFPPVSEVRGELKLRDGDFFLSNFELEQGNWEIAQGVNINSSNEKTPLSNQHFQLPTAGTLGKGQVMFNFGSRLFFLPKSIAGDSDTAAYPYIGFTWGITNNLELTLDAQRVDTASPGTQGEFRAERSPDETNFFLSEFQELSLDLKQKFWQNQEQDLMFSGVVSLSWGSRGYSFYDKNGVLVDEGERSGIVPALQFPLTTRIQERLLLTISPTVAFFSDENALQLHRPPTDDPGSFGTTFGLTGAVSFQINPRLTLWGDAFFPVTGNNSISRESGKPDKAIAYNAGFRYLVNPRIGLDIFASNTLGSTGPLALTGDRDFTAFAANLVFFPSFIGANRQLPDSFNDSEEPKVITTDGVGFFDGGTLPSGKFMIDLQGGSQGILTAFRYGVLRDLELGIYLDYIAGDIDESEQGFSGKLQFLNQAAGAPLTVSLAGTIGLTNEPFVNFINDDRNEFDQLDLDKGIPFFFQGDNKEEGQLFIATFSLPLHYQFNNGAAVWLTPTLGYVQRGGTQIAGFNMGGSFPVGNFSFVGEIGANLTDDGNAFIGNTRENVIPWTVAVRWGNNNNKSPQLELYLTNRVGSSAWHQLRVRDQNETAVGVGLSIPF